MEILRNPFLEGKSWGCGNTTKEENMVGGNIHLIQVGEGGVWFCCCFGGCFVYLFTFLLLISYLFIYLFIILSLEYCHICFLFVDVFAERSDKVDVCIGQL